MLGDDEPVRRFNDDWEKATCFLARLNSCDRKLHVDLSLDLAVVSLWSVFVVVVSGGCLGVSFSIGLTS